MVVDDLFTLDEDGEYFYTKGYSPAAVYAVVVAGVISILTVVIPKLGDVITWLPDYSWFVGCGLGFAIYYGLALKMNIAGSADAKAAATVAA